MSADRDRPDLAAELARAREALEHVDRLAGQSRDVKRREKAARMVRWAVLGLGDAAENLGGKRLP